MPQIVKKNLKPRSLVIGDEVTLLRGHTELVADIAIPRGANAKYATISTDYGTTRVLLDEDLEVYREVPTEEEAEADRIARAHRWIRERMAEAEEQVEKARVALIDSLDMRDPTWHGRRWEHYTTMQIIRDQWLAVVRVAVAQEVDLVEATKLWRKDVAHKLLAELRHGSWSSSGVTNVANQIIRQTQAEWIDDLRWYVL